MPDRPAYDPKRTYTPEEQRAAEARLNALIASGAKIRIHSEPEMRRSRMHVVHEDERG